jgi:cardiolipin synthase
LKKLLILGTFFALITLFTYEELEVSPLALPGEAAKFYSPQTKDNLEDTLVSAIRNAKQSVTLVTYTLKSAKIIQALNNAANAGIDVRAVYDQTASLGVEKRLSDQVHATARGLNGLMHLKLLIIDGRHTWLGSANMTRDSLKSHANLITHLDNEGFAEAVLLKGHQVTGHHFEKPIPPQLFTIANQTLELRFLPDDPMAIDRIKELIRSAKKTIQVAMFTFTREDLADTLIRAARRGVKVEVIMDFGQSKSANKKIVALLQKNDIPVILKTTGGLMHHKFMLIDDDILEHGSANWTKAAFRQNDDYVMIIYPLDPDQKKVMNQIWKALNA